MALEQRIGQKTYAKDVRRVPHAIGGHGVLPLQYVQPWKTDMKNRKLIMQNASLGGVPHYEHDNALYLEKREQRVYNAENRVMVDSKYQLPPRKVLLHPPRAHRNSWHQSSLMRMTDGLQSEPAAHDGFPVGSVCPLESNPYRLVPTEIPVEPLGSFPIEPALVEPPTPQPTMEPPPIDSFIDTVA